MRQIQVIKTVAARLVARFRHQSVNAAEIHQAAPDMPVKIHQRATAPAMFVTRVRHVEIYPTANKAV